ncbi:hypothetical protein BS78_03G260200 [Paspalum vaginatum]|uniref:Uncharacterized protein n=1 Tax=Paspalum vaginatum TaxID=158149 RepID=A0A9W7X9L3_9POAL|nr:hypothetical protein BS78_K316400 [Paspalum vaginatum]KAJ1285179.1 hypothetical protein BS78_03G260200 [Paspalum vaginatum]
MRREGRQRGWVFTVDRSLVDPEGKLRTRAVQVEGAAAANGGFVKAPRKPTNHSKPAVGPVYKYLIGKGEAGSGRGRHKFKHDEVKMYYLDLEGAADAADEFGYEMTDLDWY